MKFKDIQNSSDENLLKKKKELELELMKERGTIATGTAPKSPGQLRNTRKTLARIEQVLMSREDGTQTTVAKTKKASKKSSKTPNQTQ